MTEHNKRLFQKYTGDDLIEVQDKSPLRCLFINKVEQTRINIDQSEQLSSAVHRALLACLLFIDTPETVLLGGLGGGALARYLHNRKPAISGDAVEINETIAMLAKQYFNFPAQSWNLVVADIRQWRERPYDLMIVDIAEGELTPAWLTSETMLSQLRAQLSEHGVLAINLLVDGAGAFTQALTEIRKVFKRQTLCLSVPEHKNIIIFAFNQPPQSCSLTELAAKAEQLTDLWGLEFPAFIEQLKKDNPKNSGIF